MTRGSLLLEILQVKFVSSDLYKVLGYHVLATLLILVRFIIGARSAHLSPMSLVFDLDNLLLTSFVLF